MEAEGGEMPSAFPLHEAFAIKAMFLRLMGMMSIALNQLCTVATLSHQRVPPRIHDVLRVQPRLMLP
jgi:hypothetical protein